MTLIIIRICLTYNTIANPIINNIAPAPNPRMVGVVLPAVGREGAGVGIGVVVGIYAIVVVVGTGVAVGLAVAVAVAQTQLVLAEQDGFLQTPT